jgi:hypothetical protein
MSHFAAVDDPRRYRLSDILSLTICAIVSGANNGVEIEEYGENKWEWLREFLQLAHEIPSHDTLSDVLAWLDPEQLKAGFQSWASSLAVQMRGVAIQIDGQVLCGSGDPYSVTPSQRMGLRLC